MNKKNTATIFICTVVLGVALSGCGSVDKSTSSNASPVVSGIASLDTTTNNTVSLKDSSVPAVEKTTKPGRNGFYLVNVTGLKPPFILKAASTSNSGTSKLYSVSTRGGRTNINPLSDTAVAAAAEGTDRDDLYDRPDPDRNHRTAGNLDGVINRLRTVLAPLFALYQTSGDPINDDIKDDNNGLRGLFHDVRVVVNSGTVTVTNRQTGGLIFSGQLNDLAAGTFHPENMPAGPGSTSGATLYELDCSSCHEPLATSTKKGVTASAIQSAITNNVGGMGTLSDLTVLQLQAIAAALTSGAIPPPAACTYTYSPWDACQSDNTQARNLLSSAPAGCIGTPVLLQACVFGPPPATCNSFTYSAWGTCQSNNTQTRTVASSSPAGCTGGTPVLTQSCTYVPPVTACTSFTYSAWGVCQSDGTQTRTELTASPAGCSGGTPVLSQSCTYVPPTQACGSCHTIPPSTGQHTFHVASRGYACSTCHGTGYSSTAVNAATHDNGAIDVVSSLNYNATASSCSPGCHGTRTW